MKKTISVRKILQALYYIQRKAPADNQSRFSRVYLLKMIFAADRYHLRHFGFMATDDNYFAMKLGPVASATYNILKHSLGGINSAEMFYLSAVKEISEHDVVIEEQGEDELSESFKEAIDFALREFGHYNWEQISSISHCYPEWKKHESALAVLETNKRIEMSVRDFFDDPSDEGCFAKFDKDGDPFKEDKDFLALLKSDYDAHTISA